MLHDHLSKHLRSSRNHKGKEIKLLLLLISRRSTHTVHRAWLPSYLLNVAPPQSFAKGVRIVRILRGTANQPPTMLHSYSNFDHTCAALAASHRYLY